MRKDAFGPPWCTGGLGLMEGDTMLDRFRGSLLGLAAGDALGTTLEFQPPGSFAPLTDMVGGGPFRLTAGQWTDDTSMALCLAQSLVEREGFDPSDQMARYVRWYREGYLSTAIPVLGMFQLTALHISPSGETRRESNAQECRKWGHR
jgi:ADP-ribosylglycohydrolase